MYNLQLSHWRRARIWIDDLPSDYVFEFLGHIETRFGSNTTLPSVRRVAIEILIPHGGKSEGMVGSDAVLPAGQLRVFLATHGTFNSSIFFFRRLGKALFKIMTAPVLPLDEEEMARFLDEVLKSISSEG